MIGIKQLLAMVKTKVIEDQGKADAEQRGCSRCAALQSQIDAAKEENAALKEEADDTL